MFGDSEYIRLVRRVRLITYKHLLRLNLTADISNMHACMHAYTIICIYDLAES